MAKRPRHPNKDIEDAVVYAEKLGWRAISGGKSHAKFKLLCPHSDRTGCITYVWSTPKNAGNHARDIKRLIDKCSCGDNDE